ncbi:uncharacterized protein LOC144444212 [Glandiceps talaboti]
MSKKMKKKGPPPSKKKAQVPMDAADLYPDQDLDLDLHTSTLNEQLNDTYELSAKLNNALPLKKKTAAPLRKTEALLRKSKVKAQPLRRTLDYEQYESNSDFSLEEPQDFQNDYEEVSNIPPPPPPPALSLVSKKPKTQKIQFSSVPVQLEQQQQQQQQQQQMVVVEDMPDEDQPKSLPFSARDLIVRKGKLTSRLKKKAEKRVDFTRSDLLSKLGADITTHFPIGKFKTLAKTGMPDASTKSKMSLYGLEQTTDMVIKTWLDNWSGKGNMYTLIMHGCVNITDIAVEWISQSCPNLETVIFSGCRNLTERSVIALLKHCPKLQYLSVVGSSVSSIPVGASRLLNLNVKGCPVHTPMKDSLEPRHVDVPKFVGDYYAADKTKTYPAYKMVMMDVGSGIKREFLNKMNFTSGEQGKMCNLYLDWVPKSQLIKDTPITYTVLEVKSKTVLDLFTSERCVYLLTFDLDDQQAADKCAQTMGSVLVQSPRCFFVIVGTHQGKVDSGKVTKLTSDIKSKMAAWRLKLTKKRDIIENDIDDPMFSVQMLYSRIQNVLISSEHCNDIDVYAVNTVSGEGIDKLHDDLIKIKKKIDRVFPQHVKFSKEFVDEAESFLSVPQKTSKKILPLTDQDFFFGGWNKQMELHTVNVPEKILEILHMMGKVLFFKDVDEKPVIFEIPWFVKILNTLLDDTPNTNKANVAEFGEGTPVWTMESIQQKLSTLMPADQIVDLVPLLQDLGLCIKVSVHKNNRPENDDSPIMMFMYPTLQSQIPELLDQVLELFIQ